MAYIIYKTNGNQLLSLLDGTVDTSTGLNLVGKNFINYGTVQNENFVRLLENQANDTAPQYPLVGQLWYNTTAQTLSYYDGTTFNAIANTASLGSGVSALNAALVANVATLKGYITSNVAALTSNAAAQDTSITNLWANAAVQNGQIAALSTSIDTVNDTLANLAVADNALTASIAATNVNVASLFANAAVQDTAINNLWANAAAQAGQISSLQTTGYITAAALVPYATVDSPSFSGTPQSVTTGDNDNTTAIATTAFVRTREAMIRTYASDAIAANVLTVTSSLTGAINLKAPTDNPTFTGAVIAPTPTAGDVSQKVATTSFVKTATEKWDGSRKYVSTSAPTSGDGSDGDIWFQYQ